MLLPDGKARQGGREEGTGLHVGGQLKKKDGNRCSMQLGPAGWIRSAGGPTAVVVVEDEAITSQDQQRDQIRCLPWRYRSILFCESRTRRFLVHIAHFHASEGGSWLMTPPRFDLHTLGRRAEGSLPPSTSSRPEKVLRTA